MIQSLFTQERQEFLAKNCIAFKAAMRNEVVFIDWSPGNGTSYQMLFAMMPGPVYGTPVGAFAITDLNHTGKTMFGGSNDHVALRYVREKLGFGSSIMHAVIINAVIGDIAYAQVLLDSARDNIKPRAPDFEPKVSIELA